MSEQNEMLKYLQEQRDEMREKHDRVLPTGELLFNRFDKAKYLNMGERSSIYDSAVVMGDVTFGDVVWVGPNAVIEGINGKIKIGNFVSIGTSVMIVTHDSAKYYLSGGINEFLKGEINIGSYTAISANSMILQNVNIGDHCFIMPGTVINKNVDDFSIMAGFPAKRVGTVVIKEDGTVDFDFNIRDSKND
ncbi:MAG: acyltransferase [Anaerovoracaceae bacterium]